MAINVPGLIAVIVFYIAILLVGLWAARKGKSSNSKAQSEEVMVAGRNIGVVVGMFTVTATWVGGGYINGTTEAVVTSGLVWCQGPIGYTVALVVSGTFFAKRMRNAGYVTMMDPFQYKYGTVMGGLLYIPALLAETFWSASILSALGATLSVIIDLENNLAIIISSAIAVLYTLFGGLYSVAYTDVVQLFFIFIGLWLSFPFALTHEAVGSITVNATTNWVKELDPAHAGFYFDIYMLLIMGGVPWQEYFQRVLASKSAFGAQIISYAAAFGCIVLAAPAVLMGAIGTVTDWNQTDYVTSGRPYPIPAEDNRLMLPLILQYLCPTVVSFFGLGAISAAVMSSTDSSFLAASSMFARNIYGAIFRPSASECEVIWVMRFALLGVATLATVMAIVASSIYALFVLCGDLVYVTLFPQLTCVIYMQDSNTYGSLAGYIIAMFFRLTAGEPLLNFPTLIEYPWYDKESNTQYFPIRTLAMLLNFIMIIIVSYATKFLFGHRILARKWDIFKCFVKSREEGVGGDISLYNTHGEGMEHGQVNPALKLSKEDIDSDFVSSSETYLQPSSKTYRPSVESNTHLTHRF